MERVKGRVCIVTCAAVGIGEACARRLGKEGAQLALFDMQDDAGSTLVASLQADGVAASTCRRSTVWSARPMCRHTTRPRVR